MQRALELRRIIIIEAVLGAYLSLLSDLQLCYLHLSVVLVYKTPNLLSLAISQHSSSPFIYSSTLAPSSFYSSLYLNRY